MTSKELTPYAQASLAERQDYARVLATAGDMIPRGLRDPKGDPILGKVLLVMETGAMLGIHPVAALQGVNVIEGKATLSAGLMSALIRRAGHSLKVETSGTIEGGDLAATVTLTRKDTGDTFTSTWTPKRAHQAGLCTYAEKDGVWSVRAVSQSGKALPWQAYTIQLCKARAISEVYIEGATDLGMGAVYTPEELGGDVDEPDDVTVAASEPIDAEVVEATRDWASEIGACNTRDTLRAKWEEVRTEGALLEVQDGKTVKEMLHARAVEVQDPGEAATDEQVASITEWSDTLGWNSTALVENLREILGRDVDTLVGLTAAEAASVISSLKRQAEAASGQGELL